MTQEQFEKTRLNCKDCCIKREPISLDPVFTCHNRDGENYGGSCRMELCPMIKNTPADNTNTQVDIHKIIDDAMEKKDRTVCVFMTQYGVRIQVDPIDEHKPHWVEKDVAAGPYRHYQMKCSECGYETNNPTPYCPACGEKLAAPVKEEPEDGE